MGRPPLDLFYETKGVNNPTRSRSLIVCLKVADIPYLEVIDRHVKGVPLMSRSKLPPGEQRWTCRVWVKEALRYLHAARVVQLPASVGKVPKSCPREVKPSKYLLADKIEQWGLYTADSILPLRMTPDDATEPELPSAGMINDLRWMFPNTNPTAPMDIDQAPKRPVRERYYGPKPMITDTTQPPKRPYYGPKPMITDSTHRPTVQPNYHGTTPMVIDSTGRYTSSSRRAY